MLALLLIVCAVVLMALASFSVPMGRFNPCYAGWTLLVIALALAPRLAQVM